MRKEMFNPMRLFRRKDQIDDAATAYIEGRATASEKAELESRLGTEPGLREELDSLRATVSLLRSIEPAKAPRSFALAEAPVRVRRRSASRRFAMAPAVIAIAAAAGVGLLAVGNLADVVSQSGSSSASDTSIQSEKGESGDFLSAYQPENENDAAAQSGLAAFPTGTPGPLDTPAPAPESTATTGFVPAPTPGSSDLEGDVSRLQESTIAPDTAITAEKDPDAPISSDEVSAVEGGDEGFRTTGVDAGDGNGPAGAESSLLPPSPAMLDDGDDSLAIPLWQLEVALAALALAMVVTWAYMRRRAAAEAD